MKHSKPESTGEEHDNKYMIEIEYNDGTMDDQPSDSMHRIENENYTPAQNYKPTPVDFDRKKVPLGKKKNRNKNQQIIYVMPGPMIENVNIPSPVNIYSCLNTKN